MSEFRFACPHCGQRISGDANYRGCEISCPACQRKLTVPAPAAKRAKSAEASDSVSEPGNLSTHALLSFVCALALGIGSVPGIILGHMAKARLKRQPAMRGHGLAAGGLVLGYTFLFLSIGYLTVGFFVLKPKQGRQLIAAASSTNTTEMLASRRVDEVKIGDPVSEFEHDLKGRFTQSGEYMERSVRDAVNGGFISYVMRVDPSQPMTLRCTYWGNDSGRRRFDVLVNETTLATQTLQFNDPGRFFDVEYDLPEILTRGRTNVTVVFQAYPRKTAGGLYGCQMLRR